MCGQHNLDRRRIVQISPGGGVGQQQMVPGHGRDRLGVVRIEAHPAGDPTRQPLPDHRMVTGIALAQVVQQRSDQQQVRPGHLRGEARWP